MLCVATAASGPTLPQVKVTDELVQICPAFCFFICLVTDIPQSLEKDEKVGSFNVQFHVQIRLLLFEEEQYCIHQLLLIPASDI